MKDHDGKLLGIDLGTRRHGIAISDLTWTVARPYSIIKRGSKEMDRDKLAEIVETEGIVGFVVGLPTYLNGLDSEQTAWVRDYTQIITKSHNLPVYFQNEGYSSRDAEAYLKETNQWRKKQDQLDAYAAAIILQDFLDQKVESEKGKGKSDPSQPTPAPSPQPPATTGCPLK